MCSDSRLATARFICYYLQTLEGSEKIATASPRKRRPEPDTGPEEARAITVPVPSIEKQRWFNRMQAKVQALREAHAETCGDLDRLIPAMLHEVFGGVGRMLGRVIAGQVIRGTKSGQTKPVLSSDALRDRTCKVQNCTRNIWP